MSRTAQRFVAAVTMLSLAMPAVAAPPTYSVHSNAEYGFTVDIPTDWSAEDPNEQQGAVILVSRFSAPLMQGSQSPTYVNIVLEGLPPPEVQGRTTQMSTEEYVDVSIEALESVLPGFSLMQRKNVRYGGDPLVLVRYRYKDEAGNTVIQEAVAGVSDDVVAVSMILTASRRGFRKHYRSFRRMLRTFE